MWKYTPTLRLYSHRSETDPSLCEEAVLPDFMLPVTCVSVCVFEKEWEDVGPKLHKGADLTSDLTNISLSLP